MTGNPLSEEEFLFLKAWREESEIHREIDGNIRRVKQEGTALKQRVPKEHLFREIEFSVRKARERKRGVRVLSIASSIIFVLGLAFMIGHRDISPQDTLEQYALLPKRPQAELTLSDGRKIQLHAEKEETIPSGKQIKVRNSGSTLVYSTEEEATEINYHTISVPRGAEYSLQLADDTKVYLNAGSVLRYPVTATGEIREVYLSGEAFFEVSPNGDRKFIVHAGDIAVEVVGTAFNVNAYEGQNNIYTTLQEGIIHIRCNDLLHRVTPGTQVIYHKESQTAEYREVETELYTSWKDGYYYFKQKPLGEIMEILSRWYDLEVSYIDQEVRTMEFGGRLKRYDDIGYLLEKMEETRDVKFTIKGKTIMIEAK